MNIDLPEKFFYSSADNRARAYVKGGILYVEGNVVFEDLMYSLAYTLKGYDICYYCGRELGTKKRTIDHMFPRMWGGVSIPNNLVPSCSNCNGEKSCLTEYQYRNYRKAKLKDRKIIFKKFVLKNKRKFKKDIILPRKWIVDYPIEKVVEDIDFSFLDEEGNEKIETFYRRYWHYNKPIVVSSNDWVFDGMRILYHAKKHGIKYVPAIIMDNVVRIHS